MTKRAILLFTLVMLMFAGTAVTQQRQGGGGGRGGFQLPTAPPGPLVNLVQAGVDAYNKQDAAYFDKMFADDIVWADEDGHIFSGKMFCLNFIRRQLMATPQRKMTASNIATGTWGDTAWAAFNYVIDDGTNQRKGTETTVFKKVGNDWVIELIHGAISAPAISH